MTALGEAVGFRPDRADGHVKDAAPQRRDGVWSDFNSRTHEHIVSGESVIALCEAIHRKQPEDVWNRQSVLDMKCMPLKLKGGDAAVGHMVAEDCGEGHNHALQQPINWERSLADTMGRHPHLCVETPY